ncbi:MAG: hypothetical protein JJE07_14630 [Flavobacteriaceae bacterium]|nr:hypothetical protein [Flavobacteriaceae bacterium]
MTPSHAINVEMTGSSNKAVLSIRQLAEGEISFNLADLAPLIFNSHSCLIRNDNQFMVCYWQQSEEFLKI